MALTARKLGTMPRMRFVCFPSLLAGAGVVLPCAVPDALLCDAPDDAFCGSGASGNAATAAALGAGESESAKQGPGATVQAHKNIVTVRRRDICIVLI